jgi:myosin heavy subunit
MDELKSSFVHFARCVKTNEEKKSEFFHQKMIL